MKELRVNYNKAILDESSLKSSPIDQFLAWFSQAEKSNLKEVNAMVLSTSVKDVVSSRTVLLKGVHEGKFVFYTNYKSNKGQQLEENGHCSLLFPWYELERQVIIKGIAIKVSPEISDEYFYSRPIDSQIGAIASEQSAEIASRSALDAKFEKALNLKGGELTRPKQWGGFEVNPTQIEFWQGRENRMHDRIVYVLEGKSWIIKRLQP